MMDQHNREASVRVGANGMAPSRIGANGEDMRVCRIIGVRRTCKISIEGARVVDSAAPLANESYCTLALVPRRMAQTQRVSGRGPLCSCSCICSVL